MDKAWVCHFYGWLPNYVSSMPISEYIKYHRASRMLFANQQMVDIQSSSFHSYREKDREDVMRALKSASKQYLFEPLKDFKDVAAKFAQRLKDGR